jgi:hypothetical protein
MLLALVTYTVNVYPNGIQINRKLEPLVESIMEGASSTSWSGAEALDDIDRYQQREEKECYNTKDKWQFVEPIHGHIVLKRFGRIL